ncbi:protein rep, partial [Mycolicibacterium smegmatis]
KSYLDRWEVLRGSNASLKPFLVTLTVKDGNDLAERFKHLHRGQRELWMRKHRARGSCLDGVMGAVWSYEVKRGTGSGLWHPHLHMIAIAEHQPDQLQLSAEWKNITGDSHVVDVRPISQEDPVSGFLEVFKYAVKFSDQPVEDTWHCYETLRGKRLIGSAGCFRSVVVPEQLIDEPFDDLPFRTLFYRYLTGRGYDLQRRKDRPA